jgi:hypothetical protein
VAGPPAVYVVVAAGNCRCAKQSIHARRPSGPPPVALMGTYRSQPRRKITPTASPMGQVSSVRSGVEPPHASDVQARRHPLLLVRATPDTSAPQPRPSFRTASTASAPSSRTSNGAIRLLWSWLGSRDPRALRAVSIGECLVVGIGKWRLALTQAHRFDGALVALGQWAGEDRLNGDPERGGPAPCRRALATGFARVRCALVTDGSTRVCQIGTAALGPPASGPMC